MRFCSSCGLEVSGQASGAERPTPSPAKKQILECPRCHASLRMVPAMGVAVVVRDSPRGKEVLLVRLDADALVGRGLWCLPFGNVEWGEDVRDGTRREVRDRTGLEVEVLEVFDVQSNEGPESHAVGTWFHARPLDPGAEPSPREGVDRAEFFPLSALPAELAFSADGRVLSRLQRELGTDDAARLAVELEAARADLERRLERRRENYRGLLELYTNELMRGAWVNELLLALSKTDGARAVAVQAATHLATQRDVDAVRVWLPGPPDRCEVCPWAQQCLRDRCLHLVARAGKNEGTGDAAEPPAEDELRIPFSRGLPAADTALKNAIHQAELPGAGARPARFEGFPLDVGASHPGTLGLIAPVPLDQNARRLFEIVARHVSALVRNARLVSDLQSANKAKSAFIARMSHELKTPLTAILGFAELLREERSAAGDEMGADGAATIESSGRQLLGIVESILEIAKLESGAISMSPVRADLGQLVYAAIERHLPRASATKLSLVFEDPPPRGAAIAWCDPARVERILDELLLNALKFTKEGGITIYVRPGDEDVVVEVKDTGIGIAPEQHERVFEPFTQADESIHLDYGGLGIGLAIAKTLVGLMGGRIWVDSALGAGSKFSVLLPRTARA
ncbi:NUDIX domain-containing protein [bacterium]|nr:NUDIX domain-containing protein [bacterium]